VGRLNREKAVERDNATEAKRQIADLKRQLTASASMAQLRQRLTLIHHSAQRERNLWNWGCIQGLFRGCSRGVWRCAGVLGAV